MKRTLLAVVDFEDGESGPGDMERGLPLAAGEVKKMDSRLEPPK